MGELPAVFILAGGMGTRLQSVVNDRPKALAEADGSPFLDFQLKWLVIQGVRKVILLTGYMSKQITTFIGDGSAWNLDIRIIQEDTPLGTGGAILNALIILGTNQEFILLNGDSLAEMSLQDFYDYRKEDVLTQIVAVYQEDTSRFGTVKFDENYYLLGFQEKVSGRQEGWINAGIYYFSAGWFDETVKDKFPVSLEKDLIPQWLDEPRRMKVFPIRGNFFDIGTTESFSLFQQQGHLWH
jgi:NDP-sugar pyrophosphorylase family protein